MNNIKESKMTMTIYTEESVKVKLAKLVNEYEQQYEAAPLRREFIFGQNVPSKSDVRRAFAQNVSNLISCAKLFINVDKIIPKQVQKDFEAQAEATSNPITDALNTAD